MRVIIFLGFAAVNAVDTSSDLISVALAPGASGSSVLDGFAKSEAAMEAGAGQTLASAYESALARAKSQISAVIHGGSFLRDVVSPEVDIRVMDSPSSASHYGRVSQVENLRADTEGAIISQAAAEFDAIANVVVGELKSALHGSSFLKKKQDLNVRVGASATPFSSTSSLLVGRESARDAGESALEHKILDMQLKFMRQLNSFVASSLGSHSFIAMAQRAPTLSDVEAVSEAALAAAQAYRTAAETAPVGTSAGPCIRDEATGACLSFLQKRTPIAPLVARVMGDSTQQGGEFDRQTQAPLIFVHLNK